MGHPKRLGRVRRQHGDVATLPKRPTADVVEDVGGIRALQHLDLVHLHGLAVAIPSGADDAVDLVRHRVLGEGEAGPPRRPWLALGLGLSRHWRSPVHPGQRLEQP